MELRHLRFFVAVAEEGSLTTAASRRLHTAQPSLSRQMRDLEYEVGVPLMTRSPRGIALTPAGKIFLDHARLALAQVEAATTAARRIAQPAKASFALGFLTGQEMDWLPEAMRILRDDLPNIDVTISSGYSPTLAEGLERGELDLAFMRPERGFPELEYRTVVEEPILAVLPSDHRLAARKTVPIKDLAKETSSACPPPRRFFRASSTPIWRSPASCSRRRTGSTIWRWDCPWSPRRAAWRSSPPM